MRVSSANKVGIGTNLLADGLLTDRTSLDISGADSCTITPLSGNKAEVDPCSAVVDAESLLALKASGTSMD
eukprot:scaffold179468_cov33-Tisochrysis_lutea.AAC.1